MDMPVDYHVRGAMLEHYRTAKADQHHAELNDRFVNHRNDLLHEFINKAIVSFLQQISIVGCCNWWAVIL